MSVHNGEYLEFALEDEAQVVEAFIQLGYPCGRDDELVGKACGYMPCDEGDSHHAID
ncbi:MAG TPA: hypothetical protein VNN10_00550 [Dehalococcoidia bacterium]|nr:hypothetical protein [Dehalococcoidia bacterium]